MTALFHIDELADNQARGFELGELSLFAVKKDGQVYLYRNQCPHLGVELNWLEDQFLDMDNALIQCATHGALFIIEDGQCVAGPCQGQQLVAVPFEVVDRHVRIKP